MGLIELVIIGFVFGILGTFAWSVVDILKRPDWEWKAIGQERTWWLVVVFMAGVLGSAVYLLSIRPKFQRIALQGGPQFGALPTTGWYPDPSGAPMLRWYDGRQWTPHTAPLPNAMPPHPNATPYSPPPVGAPYP